MHASFQLLDNTMIKAAPDAALNDVKALLGRMMFSGKAVEKKASAAAMLVMLATMSQPMHHRLILGLLLCIL